VDCARLVSDRVQGDDGRERQLFVAVQLQPVEGRAGGAGSVEARRADNDDLIGRVEHAPVGGTEDAGCRVEAEQVEVAREDGDGPPDIAAPERTLDRVPFVAGYDLEPARRLRG